MPRLKQQMRLQDEMISKVTRSNRKYILVCPYDHGIDRVTNSTILPVRHNHEGKIYECLSFNTIETVRRWLLKNAPIKT